jgi:hypothetical protein
MSDALRKGRLLKLETARIHGGLEDEAVKPFHILKDMVDFFTAGLSGF